MAPGPTYPNVCVSTASILVLYVTVTYDTNAGVSLICSIPLQRFPFREAYLYFAMAAYRYLLNISYFLHSHLGF